jgi:hypothetical protein
MKCDRINRLSLTAILGAIVCLVVAVPRARGQMNSFTEQFDENGKMLVMINNGSFFTNVFFSGFPANDPGPGGLTNALTYGTLDGFIPGELACRSTACLRKRGQLSGRQAKLERHSYNAARYTTCGKALSGSTPKSLIACATTCRSIAPFCASA